MIPHHHLPVAIWYCNSYSPDCKEAAATFQPGWSALTTVKCTERNKPIVARAIFSLRIPPQPIMTEPDRGHCNGVQKVQLDRKLSVTGKQQQEHTGWEPHHLPELTIEWRLVPWDWSDWVVNGIPLPQGIWGISYGWENSLTEITEVPAVKVKKK